jgi:hypothetical protein
VSGPFVRGPDAFALHDSLNDELTSRFRSTVTHEVPTGILFGSYLESQDLARTVQCLTSGPSRLTKTSEGHDTPEGDPMIELAPAEYDDASFLELVQRIVNGAVAALHASEVYLVQVDNWFDHK